MGAGSVLDVGCGTGRCAALRFLDPQALGTFLDAAGFQVEAQEGDWDRSPVTTGSREIITIARK